MNDETEALKLRLQQEHLMRLELEAERNTLRQENLLLQHERDSQVRLISRMRNEPQMVINQQRDHLLASQATSSQGSLRRAPSDNILNIMVLDNEDGEDNGMDVEDENDEASNCGLGQDQSTASDNDMLRDRSACVQFRSVSITNEDL